MIGILRSAVMLIPRAGGFLLRQAGKLFVPSREAAVTGAQISGTLFRGTLATGAVVVGDTMTGGHIRRNVVAPLMRTSWDGVTHLLGEERAQDVAISALGLFGDVSSYGTDAAMDARVASLEERGMHREAVSERIAYITFMKSTGIAVQVGTAEEGQRTEIFVRQLEQNEISREDMILYLSEHPQAVERLEGLGIDVNRALPGLERAIQARQTPSTDRRRTTTGPTSTAFGGAAVARSLEEMVGDANLGGAELSSAFNQMDQRLDNHQLNLDWDDTLMVKGAQFIRGLLQFINIGGWANGLIQHIERFAVGIARDEIIGQTGAGGSVLRTVAPAVPTSPRPFETADHGPAPELVGT